MFNQLLSDSPLLLPPRSPSWRNGKPNPLPKKGPKPTSDSRAWNCAESKFCGERKDSAPSKGFPTRGLSPNLRSIEQSTPRSQHGLVHGLPFNTQNERQKGSCKTLARPPFWQSSGGIQIPLLKFKSHVSTRGVSTAWRGNFGAQLPLPGPLALGRPGAAPPDLPKLAAELRAP